MLIQIITNEIYMVLKSIFQTIFYLMIASPTISTNVLPCLLAGSKIMFSPSSHHIHNNSKSVIENML